MCSFSDFRRISTFILIILILIPKSMNARAEEFHPKLCTSEICIKKSGQILSEMNKGADPCDDFRIFACGNYVEKELDNQPQVNSLKIPLLEILEKKDENLIRPYKMAKKYFQTCLNKTQIKQNGLEIALKLFKDVGGWPIYDKKETDIKWEDRIIKLKEFGFPFEHFFRIEISRDDKNKSNKIIKLSQPKFQGVGSNDELISDLDKLANSKKSVTRFCAQNPALDSDINQVIQLEQSLKNISKSGFDYEYSDHAEISVSNLSSSLSGILQKILHPQITLNPNDKILLKPLSYFEAMTELIEKYSNKVLGNYIMCKVASDIIWYIIGEEKEESGGNIIKYPNGKTWRDCMEIMRKSQLFPAFGALFVSKFKDDSIEAKKFMSDLKIAFKEELNLTTWMDTPTKSAALIKIETIKTSQVSYDRVIYASIAEDYYKTLDFSKDNISFLEMHLRLSKFEFDQSIIRTAREKEWADEAKLSMKENVNFYNKKKNELAIPSLSLKSLNYNRMFPKLINFANFGWKVGSLMAAELVQNRDWWTTKTEQNYNEMNQCYSEQYNKLLKDRNDFYGMPLENEKIDEIWATNIGLRTAFRAYESREEKDDQLLIGLKNMTERQAFWLSAFNSYCNDHQKVFNRVTSVITLGSAVNSDDFGKDFQCSKGTFMNPINKCSETL